MAAARNYTTSAPAGTGAGTRTRLVLAEGGVVSGPTVPFSVVLLGLVTVLVAAWGAAAPFFGPDLGFAADRFGAWQWSRTSLLLAVVPGAVALVCGLWVLAAATHRSYGRRPDLWLLGLIVAASGAWFVVGQYVWRALGNRPFIAPSGPTHFMLKELCFAVGPGVILILSGALFMGWAMRRELAVVAERFPRGSETPVVEPAAAVATPVAAPAGEPVRTAAPGSVAPGAVAPGAVAPAAPAPVSTVQQPVAGHAAVGQPVVEQAPGTVRAAPTTTVAEQQVTRQVPMTTPTAPTAPTAPAGGPPLA